MNRPNKHAELFTAIGQGKTIQAKNKDGDWYDLKVNLDDWLEYRIKPEINLKSGQVKQ
jgi:hypothetical protein